jgi:hypothetical protein
VASGVLEGVIAGVAASGANGVSVVSGANGVSFTGVGVSGKICFALDVSAQPVRIHAEIRTAKMVALLIPGNTL